MDNWRDCLTEIRVTIDDKLNNLLEELVESGIYPSKAEIMRCGLIHILNDLNLLPNLMKSKKKGKRI